MPTEERLRRWEVLELTARISDGYNYLEHRLLLNKDHRAWLEDQSLQRGITRDALGNVENSELPSCRLSENNFLAAEEDKATSQNLPNLYEILAETKHHPINMYSAAHGEWHGVIATLDTGSDENWISQQVVDRLKLRVDKGLVSKWWTCNGKPFESDSTVRATWSGRGQGVSHVNVFRVVSNGPFDVIFGRNVILSEEVNMFNSDSGPGSVLGNRFSTITEDEMERQKKKEKEVKAEIPQVFQKHGNVERRDLSSSKKQNKDPDVPHQPPKKKRIQEEEMVETEPQIPVRIWD